MTVRLWRLQMQFLVAGKRFKKRSIGYLARKQSRGKGRWFESVQGDASA